MKRSLAIALAIVVIPGLAFARHYNHRHHHKSPDMPVPHFNPFKIFDDIPATFKERWPDMRLIGVVKHETPKATNDRWNARGDVTDPRPGQWCGWWLRQQYHMANKELNLAANWVNVGHAASGPAPGVIAVKRHHVMKITRVLPNGHIMTISGNTRRGVSEFERSTAGIIAYREID